MNKNVFKKPLLLSIILITCICSGAVSFASAMDTDLNAALIKAAFSGNLPEVQQLIKKGANVNATRDDGVTALMGASVKGNQDIVEFLLTKGVDVNATTNVYGHDGTSACDLASQEKHQEIVDLLVRAGANYEVKNLPAPKPHEEPTKRKRK